MEKLSWSRLTSDVTRVHVAVRYHRFLKKEGCLSDRFSENYKTGGLDELFLPIPRMVMWFQYPIGKTGE